jgi:hypothetical protein
MRAKKNPKALWIAGGAAAAVASWVGFRLYVRSEVRKALSKDYDYEGWKAKAELAEIVGVSLNLPTVDEFAASVTPVWSAIMPEKAIEDVIAKGRQSDYWPENRREVKNARLDGALWALLRSALARAEQKQLEAKA